MINVYDLLLNIRTGLKDTVKASITDFELIVAVNSILQIINSHMVALKINYIVDIYNLVAESDDLNKFKLPDDFYVIKELYSGLTEYTMALQMGKPRYTIRGNFIYLTNPLNRSEDGEEVSLETDIILEYYKIIPKVSNINDFIELPTYFEELFKRQVISYVNKSSGNDAQFAQAINEFISANMIVREYNTIERLNPWS